MSDSPKPTLRSIRVIAREIRGNWTKLNYGAAPYLRDMLEMEDIEQPTLHDSGRYVVNGFLANATAWRGEVAKRVKAELKAMLKAAK